MRWSRWVMAIVGTLLVLLSVWQVRASAEGLEVLALAEATPPTTIVAPAGAAPGSRPLVLIGHGFAGSGLLMRALAFRVAHAGYAALLWDFDGHGANPGPYGSGPLLANAEAALAEAAARGYLADGRVAIAGHSMGSGVALEFGQAHPGTAATIAISPVSRSVTPSSPKNLLLLAGSLETRFVRNAEQRLSEAGGPGGDPAAGTGRKLVIVPGVEHMTILFAPAMHTAVVEWLDATFGPQPGATPYVDRRMLWYAIGLCGSLLVAVALIPRSGSLLLGRPVPRSWPRRVGALVAAAGTATLVLWAAEGAGLSLSRLLGLRSGGYLLVWMGLAGLLNLTLLWVRPSAPSRRSVLSGLLVFAALWLGVGLLAQQIWYPWLLIWQRLRLWPAAALLLLPWFLGISEATADEGAMGQAVRWLAQSAALLGGVWLAVRLSPDLRFLTLIVPAFPLMLGFHAVAAAPQRGKWPFALSGALFFGWAILVFCPLG